MRPATAPRGQRHWTRSVTTVEPFEPPSALDEGSGGNSPGIGPRLGEPCAACRILSHARLETSTPLGHDRPGSRVVMVTVQAGEHGIRFLLVSGRPLEEPVAGYGPIVMLSLIHIS